jgi:GNAT superfamily N-acetyltransferase
VIMRSRPEYAQQMEALQHLVYGTDRDTNREDSILEEQFRHHMKVFPQGQYIAVDTDHDKVVGLTATMRVRFNPNRPKSLMIPWREVTDAGSMTKHDNTGEWLYGVEAAVHPDYRGGGVYSALMNARYHVLRKLNMRGLVAGGTLKDYHRYHTQMTPAEYVHRVLRGEFFDTNLSKQFRVGFKPIAIISNYVQDPDTMGYAAMIVWDNPDFHPERAPERFRAPRYTIALNSAQVARQAQNR